MAQAMAAEVASHTDRVTGVRVMRMTGWPCINSCFYFHDCYWAPDSSRFLFYSIPGPRGGGPADVYRVDVNGHNLVRLTSGIGAAGVATAPDGPYFYYTHDGSLWRADIETGVGERVVQLPAGASGGNATITFDGRSYVAQIGLANGRRGIWRVKTDTWQAEVVYEDKDFNHTQVEPSAGEIVAVQRTKPGDITQWWIPMDGSGRQHMFELRNGTGHWMFVGNTKKILSTLCHPVGAMLLAGPGDAGPTTVVEAPVYFWHAAVSMDGQWAVSDTNWPDVGLQLVHIPSGRYETLCMSDSDNGAWNQVHPHPSFSPDASMVTFTSNRTGIPQVYLVKIPAEMKERLSGG